MSKRLQVLLEESELAEARRAEPEGDPKKRLAIVRSSARHSFPTADIGAMLAEIERGYGDDPGTA